MRTKEESDLAEVETAAIKRSMTMRLNEKEQLAIKKFKTAVEKMFGDNLEEVRLFGSKARGEGRRDSDLDIMVIISNGDWHMCDVVYGIATDILLETEVIVSPKIITRKEYNLLRDSGTAFIKNVIQEGITV
jgi:predicted nucleotidyltransferase